MLAERLIVIPGCAAGSRSERRVGKGALRFVPTMQTRPVMVGLRSLSSGAHSGDPLAWLN
jgi:hypothetical protein